MTDNTDATYPDPSDQIDIHDGTHEGAALKPCPFCGNATCFALLMDHIVTEDGALSCVLCHHCGALGPYDGAHSADDAIYAWNARTETRLN